MKGQIVYELIGAILFNKRCYLCLIQFWIMLIEKVLLGKLTARAQESPRLRMNYDLRDFEDGESQRMLNAIEPEPTVFGKVYDNEDFYTFVKAAFANCIPELNAQLKKLKMPEVKVENPLKDNYLFQRLAYLRKDSDG